LEEEGTVKIGIGSGRGGEGNERSGLPGVSIWRVRVGTKGAAVASYGGGAVRMERVSGLREEVVDVERRWMEEKGSAEEVSWL